VIHEVLLEALDTACKALEAAADYAGGEAANVIQSVADELREIMARVR
jgi:hypothetical protein